MSRAGKPLVEMGTGLNLQEHSEDEHSWIPFDTLSEANTGETIDIVADDDLGPHLVRYQTKSDRNLEWMCADNLKTIDVRDLKPQRHHESLLAVFDELGVDEGFVLVNGHDLRPLYHQFHAETGPEVRWEYHQKDPGEFRVLIDKTASADRERVEAQEPADDASDAPF